MNGTTKKWLEHAEGDFLAANTLLDSNMELVLCMVCFHAQQCIEKLMKALLIAHKQRIPKTHNLWVLYDLILPFCPNLSFSQDDLALLNDAAVILRYPGDPATRQQAEELLKICTQLRSRLLSYLKDVP